MKIAWRAKARADIVALFDHITRESPAGAARVRNAILYSINFLADWPDMGRKGREGYRELVVSRTPYIVIYRRLPRRVVIHRVLHASQRR